MWGLDLPLDWQIRNVELAQNGVNAIWTLTIEKTMATIEHFYSNEHNGYWNFFYQIIGGYFDKEEGEFHNIVHPKRIWWNFDGEEIIHVGQDAWDYESNDEHQTQYIIDITFHKANISQQTMARMLSQNILNGNHIKWSEPNYTKKLCKNLDWLMTHLTWFLTQLKNLH